MEHIIIGVDPHKLSATIEVVDQREQLLGAGRFTTDRAGYTAMLAYAKSWPDRVWAVEGSNGAGRPLAQRLLEDGEHVVDVPAKLAARVRLFDTGHNRKTDAHDAHAVAAVAVRTRTLRVLRFDGELEALRMLVDRREALTRRRVQTVDRLQALLAELLPGQAGTSSDVDQRPSRRHPTPRDPPRLAFCEVLRQRIRRSTSRSEQGRETEGQLPPPRGVMTLSSKYDGACLRCLPEVPGSPVREARVTAREL